MAKPVVVTAGDHASHYVRQRHAFAHPPEIPEDLISSLCGYIRVHEEGGALFAYKGGRWPVQAVEEPTVKLPSCRRCLGIARKYPDRVRVR